MGSRQTGKSDPNQTLLIGDDLLIEILSRIPTPVAAIRCKLVCRGWCSLISSSYFISRFKQQHMKHESRYPKPLLGMLASTVRRINIAEDSDFNFRGFNLDFLPEDKVVASCDDLILCRATGYYYYYLCNPFTMQWISLPQPPPQTPWMLLRIRTGLVCEPYNGGDPFRYRIVRFCFRSKYDSIDDNRVEMYCSETCKWIRCDDVDKEYFLPESKIAAYNGKLYWVNRGGQDLITYDPFDRTQTSVRLINGPNSDYLRYSRVCHVGECDGVLRVMRFEHCQRVGDQRTFNGIILWELQDEKVIFKDHIVSFNQDIIIIGIAGFHPRNKDVLFLRSTDSLASFNTKTRELKLETQFKDTYRFHQHYAFTLRLPWWPTPILSPSPKSVT